MTDFFRMTTETIMILLHRGLIRATAVTGPYSNILEYARPVFIFIHIRIIFIFPGIRILDLQMSHIIFVVK
jgi:hypothetical protein